MHRAGGGSSAPHRNPNRYPNPLSGPSSRSYVPPAGNNTSRYSFPLTGTSTGRFSTNQPGTRFSHPYRPGSSSSYSVPRAGDTARFTGNLTSSYNSRAAPYSLSRGYHQQQGQVREQGRQVDHPPPGRSRQRSGRPCLICSGPDRNYFHKHFSSLNLRNILGVESSGESYICPS